MTVTECKQVVFSSPERSKFRWRMFFSDEKTTEPRRNTVISKRSCVSDAYAITTRIIRNQMEIFLRRREYDSDSRHLEEKL